MRVAFQGEHGAYSEEALHQRYPGAEGVPCHRLEDVFEALITGAVEAAVVPVENSLAGSITRSYDLLRQHDQFITAELVLPIRHCLLALPETAIGDLERVHSHPSALEQCEAFLREHGLEPVAEYDTAGAAKRVATQGLARDGALASHEAARQYELAILAEDVQTAGHNRTRFVVLERSPAPRGEGPHRTSLVFATDHRPGALYRALAPLAEHGVNLVKLESRPSRQQPWQYVFHLDLEGHREDAPVRAALGELSGMATFLKVLGSYPAADEPA